MLTIALIDRHPVARVGLSCLLCENFKDISLLESNCAESFQKSFPGTNPDLVILGFCRAASANNLQAISYIAACPGTTMVIVLDEGPDPAHVVSFLRGNVKGYLSRKNAPGEIIKCIRLVLDGKRYVDPDMMELMMANFKNNTLPGNEPPHLTYKQYEIVTYLAEGLPVSSIAKKLGRSVSAINKAKLTIYRKLNINTESTLKSQVRAVLVK